MFRICTTFESGLCIRSKIKLDQIKVKRLHNSTIEIVKSEKDNQSIHAFSKSFFFLKEQALRYLIMKIDCRNITKTQVKDV